MATVADQILEVIKADILSGRLRPNDAISERTLVERFQVSRTPVREALKRLRERGMLTLGRQGVVVVRDTPLSDMKDLFDLRAQIEADAALLAVKHITVKELAELRSINRRLEKAVAKADIPQMIDLRRLFHAITAEATRNRWLKDILIHLRDNAYQVGHWQSHWQDLDRARSTIDAYAHMIDALESRDGRAYKSLVVKQILSAFEGYENRLKADSRARPLSLAGSTKLLDEYRSKERRKRRRNEHRDSAQ
jgi:DNA-binding GntR family transcriptional regulator